MQTETKIVMIPTERLHPHPDNPRKDVGDVSELAESIKANGILQNLTVVPKDDDYTVIIGHRRLAASKLAGLDVVPCVIADMTDKEQLSTMLTENMQRTDLTIYEQAKAFQQLQLDLGMSVDEIAEKAGFSRSKVYKRLKLAELDEKSFKKAVERGATIFDFAELDKLETPEDKQKVLDVIGTSNFKNVLRERIDAQNNKRKLAKQEEEIKQFATLLEDYKYESGYKGLVAGEWISLDYCKNYGWWSSNDKIKIPEDSAERRYFYRKSFSEITLYVEEKEDPEQEEKENERELIRATDEQNWNEMRSIIRRHKKLRDDFVMNFGAAKSHVNEILQMSSDAMYYAAYFDEGGDLEHLSEMMGIPLDENDDMYGKAEIEELKNERPEWVALALAYEQLSSFGDDYISHDWNGKLGRYVIGYRENVVLDDLYKHLENLGYEISDEELEIKNGTHELYWKEGETCE